MTDAITNLQTATDNLQQAENDLDMACFEYYISDKDVYMYDVAHELRVSEYKARKRINRVYKALEEENYAFHKRIEDYDLKLPIGVEE